MRTLAPSPDEQQKEAKGAPVAAAAAAAAAAVDSPFMSRPGCPPPYKVGRMGGACAELACLQHWLQGRALHVVLAVHIGGAFSPW